MESEYIFTRSCMILFRLWENKSVEVLLKGNYSEIVKNSDPELINQYRLWLSFSEERRKEINDIIYEYKRVVYTISSKVI